MSMFRKVTAQAGALVERDETGKIVKKTVAPLTSVDKPKGKQANFRSHLRQLTNGGLDTLARLVNIANGVPQRAVLDDGSYTEWVVPTVSEQRQALEFLAEFQFGKAVAQTEVVKAETEAEDHAQYAAMSDAALREAARPFLERIEKKQLQPSTEAEVVEE